MRAAAAAVGAPAGVRLARPASIRRPTGRRATFAPRRRSRRWRATRSRRISTACRSSATRCASGCSAPAFRRQARRLQRRRRVPTATRRMAGTDDPLALIQYLDLKTYLVGDINTKVDRASMAHSLEVREPLMDHPLVEWLATLPSSLKMRDGEGKWLLKKAMEPQLPHDVLYRPKMGFAVPLARWFRGPLRERVRDALLGGVSRDSGMFDPDYLEQPGRRRTSRGARDHSAPIWTLLMFDAFLRNVVEATRPAPRSSSARRPETRHAHPARPRSLAAAAQRLRVPHGGDPARAAALGWETLQLTTPRHGARQRRRRRRSTAGASIARRCRRARWRGCRCSATSRRWRPTARRVARARRRVCGPTSLHAHSPVLNALPALWVGRDARHPGRLRGARAVGGRRRRPRHDARGQPRYRVSRALETLALRARRPRHDDLRRPARRDRRARHRRASASP